MIRRLTIALLALTAAACDSAAPPDPTRPDQFAVRLTVEPAAGGPVQRVILPEQALIAVQRADLGDVRVFDGRGKPLSLALSGGADEERRSVTLSAIALRGAASALTAPGAAIRIEDNGTARVVTIGGEAQAQETLSASLIDTRAVTDPIVGIALNVTLADRRATTVRLSSSADLKSWEPLAERVLFSPAPGAPSLGGSVLTLPGVSLRDRYLRADWDAGSGAALQGVTITTARTAPLPRAVVASRGLQLVDDHHARFAVPFAAPLAAIRLVQAGPVGVLPVEVFARTNPEQPWTMLAAATLRQDSAGTVIDLMPGPWREYRIVADSRSAGFSAAPNVELLLDRIEVLAAFNAAPPYTLAVGASAAAPRYLDAADLAPEALRKAGPLPIARVDVSGQKPAPIAVAPQPDSPFDLRKLALWGVLLLGTAILAFAAFRLARGNRTPEQP
ncbi:DUF3999 family protein [Novosphingobium sp.]|uniref:DUF3999 family protein n=1 Tax=Novosphingobium sp. TaxID=1874826 RepID=UPI002734D256|nr:DUF3999 family protein [Novosphingobium sp.]MDP3906923.1 DUF3999 family protein [Novosphingobium sp.]